MSFNDSDRINYNGANKPPCGCPDIGPVCECTTPIDAKCTFYKSQLLEFLDIKTGDNVEDALIKINNLLLEINNTVNGLIKIKNVGTGEEIFKQTTTSGEQEFRTIKKGSGVNVKHTADEIQISLDDTYVKNLSDKKEIKNTGTGRVIYSGDEIISNIRYSNLKSLSSSPSIDISDNSKELKFTINESWLASKIPVPPVVNIETLTYSNSNATTCRVGGIEPGTRFDNVSIKALIDQMLYNCSPE